MKITLVYVIPAIEWTAYRQMVQRFVDFKLIFTGGIEHNLVVVVNGSSPDYPGISDYFFGMPHEVVAHDDSGWDVGAFLKAAKTVECDMMVCMNTSVFPVAHNWLRQAAAAFHLYPNDIFGAFGSNESQPHLRSSCFWCNPKWLRDYPCLIRDREESLHFEHGKVCFSKWAEDQGCKLYMVTRSGIYPKDRWRVPNGFRDGDQSELLVWDRHCLLYRHSDPEVQARYRALANGDLNNA